MVSARHAPGKTQVGPGQGAAGPGAGSQGLRRREPPAHRAAVIGHPVAHSLSPVLHQAAYSWLGLEGWRYERWDVEPQGLADLVGEVSAPVRGPDPAWAGLSVTMPHKQALMPLLDVVDPLAQAVGAVNTVVAQRSGTGPALLTGFNTDVAGIVEALTEVRQEPAPPRRSPQGPGRSDAVSAVVLGSGATACSALAALTELGARRITVAARRHAGPGRALTASHRMGLDVETLTWRPGTTGSDTEVAEVVAGADLVVSTLPAGAADALAGPVSRVLAGLGGQGRLHEGATMLDVVYHPWPTPLAQAWSLHGGQVAPGWLMLLHQAVHQVRLMTGHAPATAPLRTALEAALGASGAC